MAKLKYYFPLDNYVKIKTSTTDQSSHNEESKSVEIIEHHIKTRYTTVNIETNGLLESSFDEYKGSYIELKNDSKISIGFNDVFNKTIEDGNVLLNFFISYTEGNSVTLLKFKEENANDVLKIEKISNAYSLVFNDHNQRNTKEFGVRKNNWYNCTIHIKKDKFADVYITDQKQLISKEPIFKDVKINSSNFKIIFGPKQDGQTQDTQNLKVADLSIYEAVEQDEVIATVNTLIENQLVLLSKSSMLENVDFNLFNDEDTNRLVLQNEVQPFKIEFNLGDFQLKDDEIKTNIKGILRVKKGFFANTSIDSNGDNDEINFEINPIITDNKLFVTLNDLEILNIQELDRVLFQLEIYNLSLVKDGNNFEENFTKNNPLILDKSFDVIDNRGKNICPFDVFVFGNDTLNNGNDTFSQQINISIINALEIPVEINSNSYFSISSPYMKDILKMDSLDKIEVNITSKNGVIGLSKFDKGKFSCKILHNLQLSNDFYQKENDVSNNYDNVKLKNAFYKGIYSIDGPSGYTAESCIKKYILVDILKEKNWQSDLNKIVSELIKVIQVTFKTKKMTDLVDDINKNDNNISRLESILTQVIKNFNHHYFYNQYSKIKDQEKNQDIKSKKIVELVHNISQLLLGNITINYFNQEITLTNTISISLYNLLVNLSSIKNPSGSYPFYLEYRNIPGYRNGKVKFFIKTGRVYYSN